MSQSVRRVIIAGAASRDFHDFNTTFRNNPDYRVVAFTATQIPNIDGRRYPQNYPANCTPQGFPSIPKMIYRH